MNFLNIRMEMILPLFTGVICSLFLCALIAVKSGVMIVNPENIAVVSEDVPEPGISNFLLQPSEDNPDLILKYYSDPEYNEWVLNFFSGICPNPEVVQAILDNSLRFDVPPALAFALSWEESRFTPNAVNRNNRDGSIDRGLFQLNNRSFPNLEITSFFDINLNAYYGISHLRFCLDSGNSEVSALAMYNAGTGRVRTTGAPEVTLNYINRILDNRSKIEANFYDSLGLFR